MWHDQDCCESVTVEDIYGDPSVLYRGPISVARVTTSDSDHSDPLNTYDESWTWTFYTIGTVFGLVDIRWYGESNGYYSEEVDFSRITIFDN